MPYKRGSKWIAQVRKKEVRKEKIFLTKKDAVNWESEQRKKSKEILKDSHDITVFDWAGDYLKYAHSKYSAKTYDEKKTVFRRLWQFIDCGTQVHELSKGRVLDFLREQYETRSGYSANKDRKNLIAAWNWGIKYRGLPVLNPCIVDRFPETRQTRYVPPEREFWAVYDAAAEGQDKVMLIGFLHLAARKTELFRLQWDDVDLEHCNVRLWTRKRINGSFEYEWLPMTDDLHLALLKHRQNCLNEWVFPNPETRLPYLHRRRWMKQNCRKAGVKYFGIHAIRHLTASILAQANVPMIQIQAILRHKNLATTERYIKRLEDLKPALRMLSREKSRLVEPSDPTRREGETGTIVQVNEN
jgi:integrase